MVATVPEQLTHTSPDGTTIHFTVSQEFVDTQFCLMESWRRQHGLQDNHVQDLIALAHNEANGYIWQLLAKHPDPSISQTTDAFNLWIKAVAINPAWIEITKS